MSLSSNRPPERARLSSAPSASAATPAALPEVDSKALFGGSQRVAILHRGERYWLHATRAGKLLLTK